MRNRISLVGLIAVSACGGEPHREASPPVRTPSAEPIAGLSADVSATCSAGVQWLQTATVPEDSVMVTRVDTVLVPPLASQRVPACLVRAWLPHGRRGAGPSISSSDESAPPALGHAGGQWHRLLGFDADGPDGNLSGYQRARVQCTVSQSWDGGDDSDSTDVPGDWYGQELTCWAAPGGVQAADTTG